MSKGMIRAQGVSIRARKWRESRVRLSSSRWRTEVLALWRRAFCSVDDLGSD